jgi:hypothetical protein
MADNTSGNSIPLIVKDTCQKSFTTLTTDDHEGVQQVLVDPIRKPDPSPERHQSRILKYQTRSPGTEKQFWHCVIARVRKFRHYFVTRLSTVDLTNYVHYLLCSIAHFLKYYNKLSS